MSIAHIAAPERTPTQTTAARWFAHAAWMECVRIAVVYDFTLHWQDDETGRTLMLLGPDSPADMMLTIRWSQLDTSRLEATTGQILRWMLDRGAWFRGFTYDPFATERT